MRAVYEKFKREANNSGLFSCSYSHKASVKPQPQKVLQPGTDIHPPLPWNLSIFVEGKIEIFLSF